MKKIDCLQKEIPLTAKDETALNISNSRVIGKSTGNLRKMFFIASLAGIGLLFNGCVAGYVDTEPSYMVINRPAQPSNVHVWIDGGWGWNSQSHAYVQRAGYWDKPRQGQTYVAGRWQSSPKGKYWQNGSWQKNNNHK
jgi:hypothetical protein